MFITNTELLNEKINSSGLKKSYIAKELNISRAALLIKINNESEFKASEIRKLCELLNIDVLNDEKEAIFFVNHVDLKSTKTAD